MNNPHRRGIAPSSNNSSQAIHHMDGVYPMALVVVKVLIEHVVIGHRITSDEGQWHPDLELPIRGSMWYYNMTLDTVQQREVDLRIMLNMLSPPGNDVVVNLYDLIPYNPMLRRRKPMN
jgi:hypothetical protein